ncbi:MAG: DNA methyltransferase [Vicinamibacterales bacterium]
MKLNAAAVRACLRAFDFDKLFREHLGWDKHQASLAVTADGQTFNLSAVAQKRGFVAYLCGVLPDRHVRLKIDRQVTKSSKEHFVIYCDQASGHQVWHWVRREAGKPAASRDHRFEASQSGDRLIQRLEQIAVNLDEEDSFTLVDATAGARAAFDVDRVTKRFYDQFKTEHETFLKFIKGIQEEGDLQWYTSLMLNRLMFVYFIQKKGFLDGDTNYLRNRLQMVRESGGQNKFQSFYRYFLLRLFHEGLGQSAEDRKHDAAMGKLLGKVPYLNGGFFEVHQLEERNSGIDIPDKAFERLFDFFDRYSWHLDERELRADNEINPDVVGYIFEKYINQKQMGAYYTKEDITEYISKSTIIPFLFDTAEKKCPIAFHKGSFIWRLLSDAPDRYIYAAVRHGVVGENGEVIPLPKDIEKGVKDVSKRGGWNRPAPEPFALPTETWREHVSRRERCLELRKKLKDGEVFRINDLVTLNLDLWQFARDVIVNAEGPEVTRAFWEAIERVTVLDPTCGSGAFLFAALRILETLYSDCLECMERFVEDHIAKPHHPEQFTDFKKVLAQIEKHPSERYFVLKSIIIGNLFGVDIMEEAVEICKLRLFLKLVAQVEKVEQIEPLPDIDFNIRSGNTLVGYATAEEARKAFTESASGQGRLMLGDAEDAYKRFEEDAESVERAFHQFRLQQTTHGGKITFEHKQELRGRLAQLDAELDRFLAAEYGVNPEKNAGFGKWRASHQPFHWFVEFYGIMHGRGFDVIIGNPPYVEYKNVKSTYSVRGFTTEACGDLYAYVMERSRHLLSPNGTLGMIVPVSIIGTDGFDELRSLLCRTHDPCWCIGFAERPSKLFTGVEKRLAIWLMTRSASIGALHVSNYQRWLSQERGHLFSTLHYAASPSEGRLVGSALPKIGTSIESEIIRKLAAQKRLDSFFVKTSDHVVYYTRKVRYFVQFLDFVPEIRTAKGKLVDPTELKTIFLNSKSYRDAALAVLNSGLFFWFFSAYSDVRNVNRREIDLFRCSIDEMPRAVVTDLKRIGRALMKDFKSNSRPVTADYGEHGRLTIQTFQPRLAKPIIDEIDSVLARHYGLTDEERDFVINYDIKYRVGAEEGSEDE